MKKNKRTLIVGAILIAVLCAAMLGGCAKTWKFSDNPEEVRAEWEKVQSYLDASAAEANYRLKTQYVIGSDTLANGAAIDAISQVEYLIEYRCDDPSTANVNEYGMRIQRAETSIGKTTYVGAQFGASLSTKTDAKNATFDDYQLYQFASNGEINVRSTKLKGIGKGKTEDFAQAVSLRKQSDEATFFAEQLDAMRTGATQAAAGTCRAKQETVGYTRAQILQIAQNLLDSDLLPTQVSINGVVTTFYFELDEAHKSLALNNGAKQMTAKDGSVYYPVHLRFTQGRLDKITDHNDTPTLKLFVTYYPSNFSIPRYDAAYTQYLDADGNLQTILPEPDKYAYEIIPA